MTRALIILLLSAFLAAPCFAASIEPASSDMNTMREKAEAGQAAFQSYFGYLYLNGVGGIPRDYEEAFKWYHRAADQGYVAAEYNLGIMYDEGLGVPQNHEAGYFWLTLASESSGKPDYAARRDQAGLTLSLSQTDELKKRVAAWKPEIATPTIATVSAKAAAPIAVPQTPGMVIPWMRVPAAVQKIVNANVGDGCMIGKIEKAIEDGIVVYRAQVNKPGSASNLVRVTEGGKLISISKMP
jgi:hypothetical protein